MITDDGNDEGGKGKVFDLTSKLPKKAKPRNTREDFVARKIKELLKGSKAVRKRGAGRLRGPEASPSMSIEGNGNIQVGGDYVKAETLITKVTADVKPGSEHITDEQAAKLHQLVKEVVEAENMFKRSPKGFPSVWASLNAHCRVPAYRLIKASDFKKATTYLRKWKGRLAASRSAPKKDPQWRAGRIKAIHTINRKYGFEEKYRSYLWKNFQAESTLELTDEQLEKAYRRVLDWKQGRY